MTTQGPTGGLVAATQLDRGGEGLLVAQAMQAHHVAPAGAAVGGLGQGTLDQGVWVRIGHDDHSGSATKPCLGCAAHGLGHSLPGRDDLQGERAHLRSTPLQGGPREADLGNLLRAGYATAY